MAATQKPWKNLGRGLLVTTLFGVLLGRGQSDSRDFFLDSNRLPTWSLLVSIVATETSALTVISIPGIGFRGDVYPLIGLAKKLNVNREELNDFESTIKNAQKGLKKVEEETVPSFLWRGAADEAALASLPEKERYIGEQSSKQVFDRLAGTWTWWGGACVRSSWSPRRRTASWTCSTARTRSARTPASPTPPWR